MNKSLKFNFEEKDIERAADLEGIDKRRIIRGLKKGIIVGLKNPRHCEISMDFAPVFVGSGLSVKVNANIGSSPDIADIELEKEKARAAIEAGADTLMDLSTGGDIDAIKKEILKFPVPVGSVPVYDIIVEACEKKLAISDVDEDMFIDVVEKHAKLGIDFATVHVGMTKENLKIAEKSSRVIKIVSRGGAIIARWIKETGKENPFYENFDYLLEISEKHSMALSLGDALRPGAIADATDKAQLAELLTLGKLVERAREKGIGVIVEGPGHVPVNEIEINIKLQKAICKNAPFYVLGPLVTDVATAHDHIAAAIGGALAAYYGADFLCYVTPAEHLALPGLEDVKLGVIASRIAAHAADIARGNERARALDLAMSRARANFEWEKQFRLAIDKESPKKYREERKPKKRESCTMCGEFCAMKL